MWFLVLVFGGYLTASIPFTVRECVRTPQSVRFVSCSAVDEPPTPAPHHNRYPM